MSAPIGVGEKGGQVTQIVGDAGVYCDHGLKLTDTCYDCEWLAVYGYDPRLDYEKNNRSSE